jgi:CopG family nickel-responsive transcriptional regulator
MSVVRFGVSLEKEILATLDEYVNENQFSNRSQAIRQLISKNAVEKKWLCNNIVAGSITLVYDHHKRDILNQLTTIQHDYHNVILSSQHFHLDHDQCMEIIAVKGKANILTELSDKLIAVKGIQHGKLTMTRTD